MFNQKDSSNDLTKDLSNLLKEEGSFVKELTDVATKAAGFHARLESIEKALENDPSSYSSSETDRLVEKAKQKYSSELEDSMKSTATDRLKTF
ncbi:MAG: hypothetical protein Q4F05_11790 [bacterium]|nr:hypothetical protein [bacterium]